MFVSATFSLQAKLFADNPTYFLRIRKTSKGEAEKQKKGFKSIIFCRGGRIATTNHNASLGYCLLVAYDLRLVETQRQEVEVHVKDTTEREPPHTALTSCLHVQATFV